MRYAVLVYEAPEDRGGEAYDAAWRAYHKALLTAGIYVAGAPLKDAEMATTVRLRDGRRRVQDGPFAEAKEQLGGFFIVDLPSLDAALEWAGRCPAAATGAVEVRPVDVEYQDAVVAP